MNNHDFKGAIHDKLGVSSSYRLKLPSLVDKEKVLYLDSDIIVLKDIAELYLYNISQHYLAGVEDKLSHSMKKRIGLSGNDNKEVFVNGGVLLFNLKKFRRNNLESIIFKKLRQINYYTDQDVVNDVCRKNILSLPLKYNIMLANGNIYINRRKELEEIINDPFIIHYAEKPWNDFSVPYFRCWIGYKTIFDNL